MRRANLLLLAALAVELVAAGSSSSTADPCGGACSSGQMCQCGGSHTTSSSSHRRLHKTKKGMSLKESRKISEMAVRRTYHAWGRMLRQIFDRSTDEDAADADAGKEMIEEEERMDDAEAHYEELNEYLREEQSAASAESEEYYALHGGRRLFGAPTCQCIAAPSPPPAPMQLWAVISGNNCAETLPYGPNTSWPGGSSWDTTPYVCTNCVQFPHATWRQYFFSPVRNFTIEWHFNDSKTLEQRFNSATTGGNCCTCGQQCCSGCGEPVRWTITDHGGQNVSEIVGTWRWSNSATSSGSYFSSSSSTSGGKGSGGYFSSDDGCWGAGYILDGNSRQSNHVLYGICNLNSGDSGQCSNLFHPNAPYEPNGAMSPYSGTWYTSGVTSLVSQIYAVEGHTVGYSGHGH